MLGLCLYVKKGFVWSHAITEAWFGKFFELVLEFGLQRCQIDHSVFHLHTSASYILLMVYVDDIVINRDNS